MLDAQLRAFAAFARTLSFTLAAEELWISQPVVSKHVAELTTRVGVPLVRRVGRANELTPAGEYLANYVLRAEAMLGQALRGVEVFAPSATQHVSVVASGTPGTYLLPKAIAEFDRTEPGVTVGLAIQTAAEAVEAVRTHQFEAGIVGAFEPVPDLESEVLIKDEIVLIGLPSMAGRRVSPSALEKLPWIGREEGAASRAAVERVWREMGISPTHRIEMPSREAVKLAVSEGAGIAASTRYAIEVELRAGTLTVLDVPAWELTRNIYVISAREIPLTPTTNRFLALTKSLWGRGRPVA